MKRVESEVDINIAKDLLRKIQSTKEGEMIPNISIRNTGVSSLIDLYNQKVQERQVLIDNSSERSPLSE